MANEVKNVESPEAGQISTQDYARALALKQLEGSSKFGMKPDEKTIQNLTKYFAERIDKGEINPESGLLNFTKENFPEEFNILEKKLGVHEAVNIPEGEVGRSLWEANLNEPENLTKKATELNVVDPNAVMKANISKSLSDAVGLGEPPSPLEFQQQLFNSRHGNTIQEIKDNIAKRELKEGAQDFEENMTAEQASEIMNTQLGLNTTPEGVEQLLNTWNEKGYDSDKTGPEQNVSGVKALLQRIVPGGKSGKEATSTYADLIKKFGDGRTAGPDGGSLDLQKLYDDVLNPPKPVLPPPIKPEVPLDDEVDTPEQVIEDNPIDTPDPLYNRPPIDYKGVADLYKETLSEDPFANKARSGPIVDMLTGIVESGEGNEVFSLEDAQNLLQDQENWQNDVTDKLTQDKRRMEIQTYELLNEPDNLPEGYGPSPDILDITKGISNVTDKGQVVNESDVEGLVADALRGTETVQLPLDVVNKLPKDMQQDYININSNLVNAVDAANEADDRSGDIGGTAPEAPKWWQMGKQLKDVFAGGDPTKMSAGYTQDVTDPTTGEVTQQATASEGWGAKLGQFISSPAGQRYMGELAKVAATPVGGDKSWQGQLANLAIQQGKNRSGNILNAAENQQILSQYNPGEGVYSGQNVTEEEDELDGTKIKKKEDV